MVVWGDEDLIVPRGTVDAYAAALPDARIEVMSGVGHRPEIEDVAGFVARVSSFLGEPLHSSAERKDPAC
jgi:pimeloyl-ACP methyl ester carboxylesterase